MESPSGRACDEITNRRRARIASTICSISGGRATGSAGLIVIVRRRVVRLGHARTASAELVQQLLQTILPGDGFVVDELQLRHSFETEPRSQLAAKVRRGAFERAGRGGA